MNNIIKSLHELPGDTIDLKLARLASEYQSAFIHLDDFLTFCFASQVFNEPVGDQFDKVCRQGIYGTIDGLEIHVVKHVKPGYVILEPKVMS
jgi:hypothetical protein